MTFRLCKTLLFWMENWYRHDVIILSTHTVSVASQNVIYHRIIFFFRIKSDLRFGIPFRKCEMIKYTICLIKKLCIMPFTFNIFLFVCVCVYYLYKNINYSQWIWPQCFFRIDTIYTQFHNMGVINQKN